MKELYLLLLNKYKKEIILFLSIFTLIGIGVQYYTGDLNASSILAISISYLYCLYSWLNGNFTFASPVNISSNTNDVFWRWFMIGMSFLLHIYMMYDIYA